MSGLRRRFRGKREHRQPISRQSLCSKIPPFQGTAPPHHTALNAIADMEYTAGGLLSGFIGIWTKSDSVICFDELVVESGNTTRRIAF
ncbi:MAG: hypothetical protein ACOYW7_11680 [Nitrospirota bacterium]